MYETPPSDLLARLSDAFHREADSIIEDWKAAVYRDQEIASAGNLTKKGLVDHLPALLEAMADCVRTAEGPEVSRKIAEAARVHGLNRWDQGYKLGELLRELGLLRKIVVRHLVAFVRGEPRFLEELGEGTLARVH